MLIRSKDKSIDIPSWLVVIGLLAVDSIVCNICNAGLTRKQLQLMSKKEGS